jgi:hypothetical protein
MLKRTVQHQYTILVSLKTKEMEPARLKGMFGFGNPKIAGT